MKNVNYSKFFSKYDRDPLRKKGTEKILIRTIRRNYSGINQFRIIDIGCGSGNWLNVNFNYLNNYENIEWFGVDTSKEMLSLAKNKNCNLNLITASANALPLPANYFDFAITEYTYHHFNDKESCFEEIYRVMDKKGILLIRDIDPWRMSNCSLYFFFPKARDGDQKRFLKSTLLKTILSKIGFEKINISFKIMHGNEYETVDMWVEIMRNRTHSQLHIINDKEYLRGIKKISELYLNNRKFLEEILADNITVLIEIKAIK